MKNLLIIGLLLLSTFNVQAQTRNDGKAYELGQTIASVSESVYSSALSDKATDTILKWYNANEDSVGFFDGVESDFGFIRLLKDKEAKYKYDVLKTIDGSFGMLNGNDWGEAMKMKGLVGCGYVDFVDTKTGIHLGIWMVLYEKY